ncbi:kinase-like protein [Lentithecium fluviatile CBS 122367]|uniref:Kinase-like protein n=1 Tax=Lentithecium fluviatile CBS 122367 TaxID=1168545 RepID=A0A6G1IE68_9PLEO|nr:kinase-like protein [Lentithecium fluviatile CBS 122367]
MKGETAFKLALAQDLSAKICRAFGFQDPKHKKKLEAEIVGHLQRLIDTAGRSHSGATVASITSTEVFSSEWLEYLRSRGLILDPSNELDWSGRGQHVEYAAKDEKDIPLITEKTLGYSATALVESVMCRRIRLARKRIRCSKRLSKEDAITEVEHLQRLHHSHVVRVVGTYTLKRDLAILLYPAADWNLEEFMDDTVEEYGGNEWKPRAQALASFFACLSNTIQFLHRNNVKHMDIKPKNILVRPIDLLDSVVFGDKYKVYIADFGIARAYQSAAEVETDSPTSFTRTYAAPEVMHQDTRGFSADIFSLGCVFMEMMAAVHSQPPPQLNQRLQLQNLRSDADGDTSYYANIEAIRGWYVANVQTRWNEELMTVGLFSDGFGMLLPRMINELPKSRPGAQELAVCTRRAHCSRCYDGPEPFEVAKPLST